MTNVDWGALHDAASTIGDIPQAGQQGALAGYQLGQMSATRQALNNMDWSNPQSVQTGIGALVKAGAAQQAGALSDLQVTTAKNKLAQSVLSSPQALAAAGLPTGAQPAANQTSEAQPGSGQGNPQQAQAVLDQADQAIQGLKGTPPADLPAAVAGVRQRFIDMGVPPERIDSLLPALPTTNDPAAYANWSDKLALSHDYVQALKAHPAMGGPAPADGQDAPAMPVHPHESPMGVGGDPGPAAQIEYLNNPGEQVVNGVLEGAGIKTDRSANARAAAEPYIQHQAALQYAAPTAAAEAAGKAQGELANPTGVDQYFVQGKNGPEPVTMTPAEALAAVRAGVPIQKALTPEQQSYESTTGANLAEAQTGGAAARAKAYGAAAGAAPFSTTTLPVNGVPTTFASDVAAAGLHSPQLQAQGLGVGQSPSQVASATKDASDLVDSVNEAAKRRPNLQHAEASGQQIMGLADTVGTGAYTKALSDAAQYLPGKPSDYASNVGRLGSALAGSIRDTIGTGALPRVKSEADSFLKAVPGITSQPDQLRLYGAGVTAAARYQQAHDAFVENYAQSAGNNGSNRAAEAAWANGPGQRSFLADPAFQQVKMSNGQPATVIIKAPNGHSYGVFMPGTKQQFKFVAGAGQ